MEVGNGTAINVRNDPWLLDDYNFYMQSHVVPDFENCLVGIVLMRRIIGI